VSALYRVIEMQKGVEFVGGSSEGESIQGSLWAKPDTGIHCAF